MRSDEEMALKQGCPFCKQLTIPKRLLGFYVGSPNRLKLWECRECFSLWSNKTTFDSVAL